MFETFFYLIDIILFGTHWRLYDPGHDKICISLKATTLKTAELLHR